jgi:hypothetical protein
MEGEPLPDQTGTEPESGVEVDAVLAEAVREIE